MRLQHIIHDSSATTVINILDECGDFIAQSNGLPLRKYLPTTYNDVHKVKVRKKQKKDEFTAVFNEAFDEEVHQIRQRAVFANDVQPNDADVEPFYILPPNGFSFLYSTEVTNSSKQYQSVFESILDVDDGETFKELLKFTYTSDHLYEGLAAGAEIIIYNIPHFYALRESTHDYDEVLSLIED
jgi:hypothetical protein